MIDDILKNLVWLGHDAFLLKAGGKNIYFDPYQLAGKPEPADIILISHAHHDHCSPEDVQEILAPGTVIVTEPLAAENFSGMAEIKILAPGQSCEVGGIGVEAVPAYNIDKRFHPKSNGWIGFVLTVGGIRIYHAGDTDLIPEMKNIVADIAFLPVSGTFVMTAEEAVQAALDIKPGVAIPMHIGGASVGSMDDASRFARALEGKVRVVVMEKDEGR